MALQSSGQIKLSEIATEFGGSAPHALSEYHGEGNAPGSGEIQLAADFYGTSAGLSLSTTITSANHEHKAGITNRGFLASTCRNVGTQNDSSGHTTPAMGSISNDNISGGGVVEAIYTVQNINQVTVKFEMSTASTAWTSITVGSQTFARTLFSTSDNQFWTYSGGGHFGTGSLSFSINP